MVPHESIGFNRLVQEILFSASLSIGPSKDREAFLSQNMIERINTRVALVLCHYNRTSITRNTKLLPLQSPWRCRKRHPHKVGT